MQPDPDALGWYERAARMAFDDATLNYDIGLPYRRNGWTTYPYRGLCGPLRNVAIGSSYRPVFFWTTPGCPNVQPARLPSPVRAAMFYGIMSDVTLILAQLAQGDAQAAEQLLPLVYNELRRLAAQKLAQESPGQTLQATALVHEAYLRLVDMESPQNWNSRGHFFAAAAEAMRRILVENARRRARIKHGGQWRRLAVADLADEDEDLRIVALDEALTRLATEDPRAAKVVELHHFAGLSHELVAETLGVTVYEARQKWSYARAWLRDAMVS
jgi:RNA polymerase sigma factor (TIGR02999 family)